MTHSLNRRLSIGIVAMLAVAGSYSVVALASTTPSFAIAGGAVPETTTPFNAVLTKGAKASSYSKVTVTTVDGTAHAGVDYKPISTTLTIANTTLSVKIPVTIIPRPGYQGPRTFKVHIAAARYAVIAVPDATVTINETEAPPSPPPPAGIIWVSAPFKDGGYARCKTVGGCHSIGVPYPPIIAQSGDVLLQKWNGISVDGRQVLALYPIGQWMVAGTGFEGYQDEWEGVVQAMAPAAPFSVGSMVMRLGLVYRVVTNGIPDPFIRPSGPVIYGVQYVADTTGHYYLADDPGLKQEIQYFHDTDLTPAP